MRRHRVQALLMGCQACVFYGGAEFSRDTDLALLAEEGNLDRLRSALADLQASPIAVPPLSIEVLERGHAVHFRCGHPDVARMRIDLMSRMRGVDPFEQLWDRRTTAQFEDGFVIELLSLPDLVAAKKTQRDKDWPMIRRLIEADYVAHRDQATPRQVAFWLSESRTPSMLVETAARWPEAALEAQRSRPLLSLAKPEAISELAAAIEQEERVERAVDRAYWEPRRDELSRWRRGSM
jgi:hypothetical protein